MTTTTQLDQRDLAADLEVSVVLRSRREADFLHAVDELARTPVAERTYRTRDEVARDFGADPIAIGALRRFAEQNGLAFGRIDALGRTVTLVGTRGALAAAFRVQLRWHDVDGLRAHAPVAPPMMPPEFDRIAIAVLGFDTRPRARMHMRRLRAGIQGRAFAPPALAAPYAFPTGADGTGQTIALIELGGGYDASDLNAFFSGLSLHVPDLQSVGVDGAANTPTGDPNGPDGEVLLDIEIAGSLAPGARIVAYFAPNTEKGFLDAITTAVGDATYAPHVVSISWGGPESTWPAATLAAFDRAFADAAMMGVTVACSSGDSGSSDGVGDHLAHCDFPASSPHALACGGTRLDAVGATIQSEVAWNDQPGGGATGGGVSDAFALPAWQMNKGVPPSANPGGHVGRGVPDVAANADPQTGYAVTVDGSSIVVGGTSAAAPLWAALIARINERNRKPVGFINALIYGASAAPLRDITVGSNGAYRAQPGWDACTGLGSPIGTSVAASLGVK